MTRVVSLDSAHTLDRSLLGGKGYGLARMISAGIAVPPGFVVTTEVSREFDRTGALPDGLFDQIHFALEQLENTRGQRIGDPTAPLLVSIRSGAPVSMPGMMDTVLNLGVTPAVRDGLAERTSAEFAWDVYRRYLESFGTIVLAIPQQAFDEAAERVSADLSLTAANRSQSVSAAYELVYGGLGHELPIDPGRALEQAVVAVLRSWSNPRARQYRELKGIPHDLGTAVTVQSMIFGNRDANSATGVLFTRNPNTGEPHPFGDVLFQAQGEDVVSGRHTTRPVTDLEVGLPDIWRQLWTTGGLLERMIGDVVDIEFTIESGRLFILQARAGVTTPTARNRIRADLAREGIIDADAAVPETAPATGLTLRLDPDRAHVEIAAGIAATPGVASGEICLTAERARQRVDAGHSVVLVRPETSPDDISGMAVASAIVTARGGLVSHAAVTARELAVPTIVGADTLTITPEGVHFGETFLPEGEAVTVDADTGRVLQGCVTVGSAVSSGGLQGQVPAAPSPAAEQTATESGLSTGPVDPLLVLHALRVAGLSTPDRIASAVQTDVGTVTQALTALAAESLVKQTNGRVPGWVLTPSGRTRHADQIRVTDPDHRRYLERTDDEFCEVNEDFKKVCTEWQMRTVDGESVPNSHDDPTYDGQVLDSLAELHTRICALTGGLSEVLGRFSSYQPRFSEALARCRDGDISAVTRPMSGSYHDIWMELHEDLIVSLGRARSERDGG